ncbi:MAG: sigma-54-dependent transcriptional regulator [Gammaproteobacteria bacterium]
MSDTLLIIEDEKLLGDELKRRYSGRGFEVLLSKDCDSASRLLMNAGLEPLVVLSDISLPDGNALDLLEKVRSMKAGSEWIFLTGWGGISESVRALRLGAFDFLEKPCELERLDVVVEGAARSGRAQRKLRDQADNAARLYPPEAFVGHSRAAQAVRTMLAKLSTVPLSALIVSGETGTGKGLAARILHYSGARRDGPLVELNCAALPRELIESELFGYEPGAFTGAKGRHRGLIEQAMGGTLFLDEIGEMPLDLQAKLLKAIEDHRIRRLGGEREVDVDLQVVAASHRALMDAVAEGAFRSDLYHRLSVFCLSLPPLRERTEDLEDLVPMLAEEFNIKSGKRVKVIPEEVWSQLRAHHWPGNVRELRNVIERCVLLSAGESLPARWLHLETLPGPEHAADEDRRNQLTIPLDGSMSLEDMDRYIIENALQRHGFNVTATARALCTTRETLRYRIQKYDLKMSNS